MYLLRALLKFALCHIFSVWIVSILSRSATYGPVDALLPNHTAQSPRINRILLLTAHPDDECMFFGPTISALMKHPNNVLYSLCLSTGNSEGLGHIRKDELVASMNVFGIPSTRVQVLNHTNLQDNITETWDADLIAKIVNDFIYQHDINTIITFDEKGISGHPNHISLPRGIQRLLLLNANSPPLATTNHHQRHLHLRRGPLRFFTLTTVPLTRKYTSALSHFISKLQHRIRIAKHFLSNFYPYFILDFINGGNNNGHNNNDNDATTTKACCSDKPGAKGGAGSSDFPSVLDSTTSTSTSESITLISNLSAYITTLNAMLQHRSQLVWFRWLYVAFSRYMWVNNLVEVPARHVARSNNSIKAVYM